MVFALLALNPLTRDAQYQKIEARAKGGAGAVTVGEVDVNFTTANRVPFPPCDFTDYTTDAFQQIKHFSDLIHENGAVALTLCRILPQRPSFSSQQVLTA